MSEQQYVVAESERPEQGFVDPREVELSKELADQIRRALDESDG